MNFDKENKIARIISRELSGTISPEERRILDEWLAASEKNRRFYAGLTADTEMAEYEKVLSEQDFDAHMESIGRVIGRRRKKRLRLGVVSAAAVLLAGILSTPLLLRDEAMIQHPQFIYEMPDGPQAILSLDDGREFRLTEDEQGAEWQKHVLANDVTTNKPFNVKVAVPAGGEYKLVLNDGTQVWLNSETEIEYPDTFADDNRTVRLSGEAYFIVEKDNARPFIVNTGGGSVRVLGTSFNISAYTGDKEMTATLVSGSVVIGNGREQLVLEPGRQAVVPRDGLPIEVREVDTKVYTSWTEGVFEFSKMPLEEVAARLSRWYGVAFEFEGESGQERFTGGTWKYVPLEEFLDRIEMVTDVSFNFEDGRIVVRKK